MTFPLWAYPLLFLTGFAAGLVDAVAGGGGVLTLPVLLNTGLPVGVVLGTNKLQATFGSVSAAWSYLRSGIVSFRACLPGVVLTFVGSLAGAWAVQRIDGRILGDLIPWLLAAILAYTVFKPKLGEAPATPRVPARVFFPVFGLGLGFYDGFFGPGVGSFWTIALVVVLGRDLVGATGATKLMNAASNLAALIFFLVIGKVHLPVGLTMGVGQMVGARVGARLVVTRGARLVRPLFIVMVTLVLARLLWVRFG
ncbi:MAG: TSUP family transporter [Opitutaceae bacterium]|nr:TSUP family transporter [Opitutaceae bacterium]